MKVCTKCKVEKPFDLFCKDNRRKNGIGSHCRGCNQLAGKSWNRRNPERKRKHSLDSYYRHIEIKKALTRQYKLDHKPRIKEYMRQWRIENKDRIKQYYENNKAWFKTWNSERRAKMNCKWADRTKIKRIYDKAMQLSIETGVQHHVDHVIPLTHNKICGLHCETNLQILTAFENLTKLNKFESHQIVYL